MAIKGKSCGGKCPDECSSGSSVSECAPRSCSPCRLSRIAEKSELQNLNDRLACYIDRARKLEIENNRLKIDLSKEKESDDQELNNVKGIYEEKLCDQKHCIDEVSREKSKLDMEIARLWEENDDLRKQLEKALKDLFSAENRARCLDSKLTDTCQKYKCACTDLKKCNDNVEFLKDEVARLKKLLEDTRKNLECETLNRVQVENNLCNTRDQLQRNDQVHDQEMKENVAHRLAEVNEMNSRLTTQYEAKLRQALHELREQYEGQIRTNRCEIELIYETKIKALEKCSNHNSSQASLCQEELQASRNCVCRLNDHIDELNLEVEQLKNRIRELDKSCDCERTRLKNKIACLEGEVQKLRCEISRLIKEYQDLMDIKVSLDMEIAAYDKLLKGEESRLCEGNDYCDLEDCDKEQRESQDRKLAQKSSGCTPCGKPRAMTPCGGKGACAQKCPCPQKCPQKPACPQKCPQKPACPQKCPQKPACPQKCPQKPACQQKCPCPPKCPQKPACPPKCPQKRPCPPPCCPKPSCPTPCCPPPPCCPKPKPCCPKPSCPKPCCPRKQRNDECYDSNEIIFDTAPIDVPAQFIPPKRCSSSGSLIPNKRQRTSENSEETDQKYFVIASANGPVEISEADPDGYFVKLHNKTNKEVDISGWTIKRLVGKNDMEYTLESNTKIDANECVSVWSTGSSVTHDPPKTVVMKGVKWMIDKRMQTILLNRKGEEQASSQRIKRVASSRSSSCSGGGFGIEALDICNRENANFNGQYCTLL